MKRYRITVSETKTGFKCVLQSWDTNINHGFYGGKIENVFKNKYSTASDAVEAANLQIIEIEKETKSILL